MAGLIEPVRKAVEDARDFDELLASLHGPLEDMDAGAVIECLAQAAGKARALGDGVDG